MRSIVLKKLLYICTRQYEQEFPLENFLNYKKKNTEQKFNRRMNEYRVINWTHLILRPTYFSFLRDFYIHLKHYIVVNIYFNPCPKANLESFIVCHYISKINLEVKYKPTWDRVQHHNPLQCEGIWLPVSKISSTIEYKCISQGSTSEIEPIGYTHTHSKRLFAGSWVMHLRLARLGQNP